jgi:hypothetical protein
VQRETLQRDRRAVTLSTTALGKQVVAALHTDVAARMPELAAALPADEQHQLATAVAQITAPARLPASPHPAVGEPGNRPPPDTLCPGTPAAIR